MNGAIKSDGTLWMWGGSAGAQTAYGALGDNTRISRSSPVQTAAGGNNWTSLGVGTWFVNALRSS